MNKTNKAIGFVIGVKTELFSNKKTGVLEIKLEKKDKKLLGWLNKRVLILKVE